MEPTNVMTTIELAAEKERAREEFILHERIRAESTPPLNYGRWGERRLKFMEENILHFWNVYPRNIEATKIFLKEFNQQCMVVYNDIVDTEKDKPETRSGDYMNKVHALTQADLVADEIVLHDCVYNELYNGFSVFEHIEWKDFYSVMCSSIENVTPELENHWRYMWETYDKKRAN